MVNNAASVPETLYVPPVYEVVKVLNAALNTAPVPVDTMLPWRASATARAEVPATCSVELRVAAAVDSAVATAKSFPGASPISVEVIVKRSV